MGIVDSETPLLERGLYGLLAEDSLSFSWSEESLLNSVFFELMISCRLDIDSLSFPFSRSVSRECSVRCAAQDSNSSYSSLIVVICCWRESTCKWRVVFCSV